MNGKIELSNDQIDNIAEQMDEEIKGTSLEDLANMPSNQGKDERSADEIQEVGEEKKVNVMIDPNTGEHKVIGYTDEDSVDDESFEDMMARIENGEVSYDESPITEKELVDFIANSEENVNGVLTEISKDVELKSETIKGLLEVVNRKINKEEFNIYRELPEEIQNMVNDYIIKGGIPIFSKEGKQFRNMICDQLISEFITNISLDRVKNDFGKELEDIFEKGSNELADSVIGYTAERNKAYREYAEKMDDIDKREKTLAILDNIDEAYNLTTLKEFSKKCKIKHIELEKPEARAYSEFLAKYVDSPYNIYDINMAVPILYRNLNQRFEPEEFTDKDVHAFFICLCKQCMNMSPNNTTEHAYMYYAIYNVVLADINKGESKDISLEFLDNVREVIYNLRKRNNNFM